MDEIRFKKLEINVHHLNRRVTDHDGLHAEADQRMSADRKDIDMLQKILESQQKNNEFTEEIAGYARETLDVVKPLLKFVRFAGTVAKYTSYIVIAATSAWHGVKYIIAKVGV